MYWSKLAESIVPYVPGEQPSRPMIKLNTNENPYPPSPRAIEAMQAAIDGQLRTYPDTASVALREAIARAEGLAAENVFAANGSDEVLAMSFLAFMDQEPGVRFPAITYSFYPVYAALFGIAAEEAPMGPGGTIDVDAFCRNDKTILFPNPNAPTALLLAEGEVRRILEANPDHPVLIDEAYAAFSGQSAAGLLGDFPNLLVIRTFSKSHALAGLRVGYALGSAELIEGLARIKDSFNSYPLSRVSQAGAQAAIEDSAYTAGVLEKIIATRARTVAQLRLLGFDCPESQANFVFVEHPAHGAGELLSALRERGILVRRFASDPRIANRLRITIGTDAEMDALFEALAEIV